MPEGIIAKRLGRKVEDVRAALSAGRVVTSLDRLLSDDGWRQATLGDRIAAPEDALTPEEQIDLRDSVRSLPPRERRVVEMRYLHERTIPAVPARDARALLDDPRSGGPRAGRPA